MNVGSEKKTPTKANAENIPWPHIDSCKDAKSNDNNPQSSIVTGIRNLQPIRSLENTTENQNQAKQIHLTHCHLCGQRYLN